MLTSSIIALVVLIHYEFLYQLSTTLPNLRIKHRFRIVFGVLGALIAHAIEVWVFAIAYYYLHQADDWGHLKGNYNGSLMDSVYFSFTTYSTLGFGDIEPYGRLRFLVGLEALTGLLLITWTASFLYLEMQRYWEYSKSHPH